MTKSKKFDKKNAVTFNVVHRSQHDPLITDEKAPQHVLVPQQPIQSRGKKNKDEEAKYGIYFDDDYDYLQHLKECQSNDFILLPTSTDSKTYNKEKKEKPKVMLPSSMFESEVEEKVGMLNKAAPQSGLRLDLDPDIVAAMDDDFDFENPSNELEDDFVIMANQLGSLDEINELNVEESDQYDSEACDDVGSLIMDDDTKSRFTDYSMSSSIIRRNDNLKLLDNQFEQLFAAYDDSEIGALETEEIEGTLTMESDLLKKAAEEFEANMKRDEIPTDRTVALLYDSDSEQEEPTYKVPVENPDEKRWDCESIISTYSNIYNHPALIKDDPPIQKIRINPKTGIPIVHQRLTAQALKSLNNKDSLKSDSKSIISTFSMLSIRSKNETLEEKHKRKSALKEYRKERRAERKANTIAFKEQKKKLEKELINKNVNKTVRVI